MENGDTFFAENPIQVEIVGRNCEADFSGTVILYARATDAVAGIRDVELMAVSPRAALFDIFPFKGDTALPQLVFDKERNRTVFDKCRQSFGRQSQRG